jgi:hypothetical protein
MRAARETKDAVNIATCCSRLLDDLAGEVLEET